MLVAFAAILPGVWQRNWTVDSVAAGDGQSTLKYLAPYVIRGPISDRRVTCCHNVDSIDDAWLIVQIKRSGSRRYRPMRLTVGMVHWPAVLSPCVQLELDQNRNVNAILRVVGGCWRSWRTEAGVLTVRALTVDPAAPWPQMSASPTIWG